MKQKHKRLINKLYVTLLDFLSKTSLNFWDNIILVDILENSNGYFKLLGKISCFVL